MKHVTTLITSLAFFGLVLLMLVGCGAERTVDVTFNDAGVKEGEKPTDKKPVAPAVKPLVIPETLNIEAKLSEDKLDANVANGKVVSRKRFTLSLAQFQDGFPEAVDLTNAESFKFRSKYDKGCDKSGFRFAALSPSEPSANVFHTEEPEFKAHCNQLFDNFAKDMRVEFTNVPLVKDRSKVIPLVTLHMIP